jgi:hypothetical protein
MSDESCAPVAGNRLGSLTGKLWGDAKNPSENAAENLLGTQKGILWGWRRESSGGAEGNPLGVVQKIARRV